MKTYNTILLFLSSIFYVSCSRHSDDTGAVPTPNNDLLTTISRNWQLYMVVVGSDKGNYYITGSELTNQSLYLLDFERTGTYAASNPVWSGRYHFVIDSTQLILEPANSFQIPCALHIDNISRAQMQFSSPWVEVNPEKSGASNYERFIAYQAFTYLGNHQQDISKFRSVRLQLRYLAR